jgi:hypothetical protein
MLNETQQNRIDQWEALVAGIVDVGARFTKLETDLGGDRRLAYTTEGERALQVFDSALGDHLALLVGDVLEREGLRRVIVNAAVARALTSTSRAPMESFASRVERVVAPAGGHW